MYVGYILDWLKYSLPKMDRITMHKKLTEKYISWKLRIQNTIDIKHLVEVFGYLRKKYKDIHKETSSSFGLCSEWFIPV